MTSTTFNIIVQSDTLFEPDETFAVTLSNPTNAGIARAQGVATILNDDEQPTIQLSDVSYQVSELAASAVITVVRTGGTNGGLAVDYVTVDDPAAVPCADTTTTPTTAYARCDYATVAGTLTFAAGETFKTFAVPIVNDVRFEQAETFRIMLSNPRAARLGPFTQAAVTIADDDTGAAPNPIYQTPFLVRQHYLDFLAREPEQTGFDAWVQVLNGCPDPFNTDPNSPSAQCDRITVSSSFFNSPEFKATGFYVFRFYKLAFGRLPQYAEIIPDMSRMTAQTAAEFFQKKAAFTNAFVARPEFANLYGALVNADYVAALMNRYQLNSITTPDPAQPDGTQKITLTRAELVARLDNQTLTRAQVLRAIADSEQVSQIEFNPAFVAAEYYGYLRRTPEPAGYQAWLNYLNAHPTDFRTMVNGFFNSLEYRLRFGQP